MPSILESVSATKEYYWLYVSWGVAGSPANLVYIGDDNARADTYVLNEAMKMISGSSSIGVATIAISIVNEPRMIDGNLIRMRKTSLSASRFITCSMSTRPPTTASTTVIHWL